MRNINNTPVTSMDSKLVYDFCALRQFRERNSTFEVVSPYHSAVDVSMEEDKYNKRKQQSTTYVWHGQKAEEHA